MSQRDRILGWLRERGAQGVHSFELYEEGMPRGAAVICTLRKQGYDISSRDEKFRGESQGVRYVLRETASGPVAVGGVALFPPTPSRGATSAYDVYGDAA